MPDSKRPRELARDSGNEFQISCLRKTGTNWPKQLGVSSFDFLELIGDPAILTTSTIAVFCSSQCPGDAILKTMKWGSAIAEDDRRTVIGGFHSAMEKSVLEILLDGRCRISVFPARSLERYRIPDSFKAPIAANRLDVVSSLPKSVRSNSAHSSRQRNQLIADLATEIVVAYAAPKSRTEQFAMDLLSNGKKVYCLDTGCELLMSSGAVLLPLKSVEAGNGE